VAETKKSESLMIRISPEVKSLLEKRAGKLGMNMSEYARLLIIEDARRELDGPVTEQIK
jgi:hypothetical protein